MKSTELKLTKFITNFYTTNNFTFRMESMETLINITTHQYLQYTQPFETFQLWKKNYRKS